MLGFGSGVFATTQGAERINFTYGLAFFVGCKKWADVRQLAAGAAARTGAFAVFGDGQKRGEKTKELGCPGVPGYKFCSFIEHTVIYSDFEDLCNK